MEKNNWHTSKEVVKLLRKDCTKMREAGNNLAINAIRVARDYDGVHRLMLAVSGWAKVIADEGGRIKHTDITSNKFWKSDKIAKCRVCGKNMKKNESNIRLWFCPSKHELTN